MNVEEEIDGSTTISEIVSNSKVKKPFMRGNGMKTGGTSLFPTQSNRNRRK